MQSGGNKTGGVRDREGARERPEGREGTKEKLEGREVERSRGRESGQERVVEGPRGGEVEGSRGREVEREVEGSRGRSRSREVKDERSRGRETERSRWRCGERERESKSKQSQNKHPNPSNHLHPLFSTTVIQTVILTVIHSDIAQYNDRHKESPVFFLCPSTHSLYTVSLSLYRRTFMFHVWYRPMRETKAKR
jgi:hypothetical protein